MRNGSGFRHQLAFVTALLLGVTSVGLYSWGTRQWDRHFARVVPLLDNLMLAKDSLAEGYVWLEAHLRGNPAARIEAVDEAFQRALEAVDAGIRGGSTVAGLTGTAVADEALLRRLGAYRDAIAQAGTLARERCEQAANAPGTADLDLRLFAASHGLILLAESVNADLHRDLERTLSTQRNFQVGTLTLWIVLVGGSSAALFVTGRRRAAAEAALRRAHGELEQKVAERTAELTHTNRLLQRSERELRALSSRLLTVQEAERSRVARELHDEISQALGAAKFRVEHVMTEIPEGASPGAEASCRAVVDILRTTLDEVRRTYMELRPSVLDDLGVVAAIGWYCREFASAHPEIEVETRLHTEERLVSEPVKTAVFRIVEQAMDNVSRHSGASRAVVRLESGDDAVLLSVEDDGRGFDPDDELEGAGDRGLGLGSMRERALGTGGSFAVESTPGRGTRVQVRWSASV